jgi:hypothetical protein
MLIDFYEDVEIKARRGKDRRTFYFDRGDRIHFEKLIPRTNGNLLVMRGWVLGVPSRVRHKIHPTPRVKGKPNENECTTAKLTKN